MRTDLWQMVALSGVGCVGMAVQDVTNTYLVRAIATGRGFLAGAMDAIGDLAKFVLLSFSGVELMANYGWTGRAFLLPVLITAFIVTYHATNLSHDLEDEDDAAEDDQRDDLILDLKARIEVLESTKQTKDAIYTHHLESELKRVTRNLANVEGLQ